MPLEPGPKDATPKTRRCLRPVQHRPLLVNSEALGPIARTPVRGLAVLPRLDIGHTVRAALPPEYNCKYSDEDQHGAEHPTSAPPSEGL